MITSKNVSTLREFMEEIESISSTNETAWFRGIGSETYKLLPSLYRHPTITSPADLISQEEDILKIFKQRSLPFINRTPTGDWDFFFIMQHFGVPTRLLDWTENPFVSLYFALTSAKADTSGSYSNNAVVWVLRPNKWNEKALSDISISKILPPDDSLMNGYASSSTRMRNNTIAIFGNHNSARIVAQRGVFVLFGKDMTSMEDAFLRDGYFLDSLIKLVIPAGSIGTMLNALTKIGFTDSVIFPDLEGLAKELKRNFNYPV